MGMEKYENKYIQVVSRQRCMEIVKFYLHKLAKKNRGKHADKGNIGYNYINVSLILNR